MSKEQMKNVSQKRIEVYQTPVLSPSKSSFRLKLRHEDTSTNRSKLGPLSRPLPRLELQPMVPFSPLNLSNKPSFIVEGDVTVRSPLASQKSSSPAVIQAQL